MVAASLLDRVFGRLERGVLGRRDRGLDIGLVSGLPLRSFVLSDGPVLSGFWGGRLEAGLSRVSGGPDRSVDLLEDVVRLESSRVGLVDGLRWEGDLGLGLRGVVLGLLMSGGCGVLGLGLRGVVLGLGLRGVVLGLGLRGFVLVLLMSGGCGVLGLGLGFGRVGTVAGGGDVAGSVVGGASVMLGGTTVMILGGTDGSVTGSVVGGASVMLGGTTVMILGGTDGSVTGSVLPPSVASGTSVGGAGGVAAMKLSS